MSETDVPRSTSPVESLEAGWVASAPPPPGPPPPAEARPATPPAEARPATPRAPLLSELDRQLAALRAKRGRIDEQRAARLLVEQALALEQSGDAARAEALYREAARSAPDLLPAVRGLRQLRSNAALLSREARDEGELQTLLEQEARLCAPGAERAQRLVDRALLLESRRTGTRREAVQAYRAALSMDPTHAEALQGLYRALTLREPDPADEADRAAHCARLGRVFAGDPALVAASFATQGRGLERMGSMAAAEDAYAAAIAADPGPGPIQACLNRLLEKRGAWAPLRDALAQEAQREGDAVRACRLLCEAARLSTDRLDDPRTATELLRAAIARAPGDRDALDSLARILRGTGEAAAAAAVREARLKAEPEPQVQALEFRRLADEYAALGELERAAAALSSARAAQPAYPETAVALDGILTALGRHEERVRLWLDEAAQTSAPPRRAAAFLEAARIAEHTLGRRDQAIGLLRSAWSSDPANAEAFDMLARLLTEPAAMFAEASARALIEIYLQASQSAPDAERRIAYLEKVAALHEDVLGDPSHAAELYEKVLALDPGRRFTMLAWQRALERGGRTRELSQALELEAEQALDPAHAAALRVRAARHAGSFERAVTLLRRATEGPGDHSAALRALCEVQRGAGRWEAVVETLTRLIALISDGANTRGAIPLWLELAEANLRTDRSDGAIKAWRAVLEIEPAQPVAAHELARALRDRKEWRALAAHEESFAAAVKERDVAARALGRAGEIYERHLRDEDRALDAYRRALAAGAEPSAWDGYVRICDRRRALSDLEAVFTERLRREAPATRRALALAYGEIIVRLDGPAEQAAEVLETALAPVAEDAASALRPGHTVLVLRLLEELYRRLEDDVGLDRTLERLTAAARDPLAQRGLLWERIRRAEARGARAPVLVPLYMSLCAVGADDPAVLEGLCRCAAQDTGESEARGELRTLLMRGLRRQMELCSDGATRSWMALRLARAQEESGALGEALDSYRGVLTTDPDSPSALDGARRIAAALGDHATALEVATRGAEAEPDAARRATRLLEAASFAAAAPDGAADEAALTLRALLADPDSVAAAAAALRVLGRSGSWRRLVDALTEACALARQPERVMSLAVEAARVAHEELRDTPLAISLLGQAKRVEWRNPQLLRAIGDRYLALGAAGEAVATLRVLVTQSMRPEHKEILLRARLELAELYIGPLAEPASALTELRAAGRLAPEDPDVQLRLATALLRQRALGAAETVLESLLSLSELSSARRAETLGLVADARSARGDRVGAEQALREAILLDADPASESYKRLEKFFREGAGGDEALAATLEELAAAPDADPRLLQRLGELQVHRLGETRDGFVHLRRAIERLSALPAGHPLANARVSAQVAHVQALLSVGVPDAAVGELRVLAQNDPTDALVLELATRTFFSLGRQHEGEVAADLRLYFGQAPGLSERRSSPLEPRTPGAEVLGAEAIHAQIMPAGARTAAAHALVLLCTEAAKVVPPDLTVFGITTRDRLPPRSPHAWRSALDAAAHAFGTGELELYAHGLPEPRLGIENTEPPSIVLPQQLGALPPREVSFLVAWLVAKVAARTFLTHKLDATNLERLVLTAVQPPSADANDPRRRVQKALSRKVRRQLEPLAERIEPFDARALVRAFDQGTLRAAWVWTGDLIAALDYLGRLEGDVRAALGRPESLAGDLVRFALSAEAATLRRRYGGNRAAS